MARPIDDKMYLTKPPKITPRAEKGKTGYDAIMSYRKNRVELLYPDYDFVDWEIYDWGRRNSDLFYPILSKKTPPNKSSGGSSGGGNYGGGTSTQERNYKWWEGYSVEGAPPWWKGFVTDDPSPEAQYLMVINSMIPYMSPEDQRYMGDYISRFSIKNSPFGVYNEPASQDTNRIPTVPKLEQTSDIQNTFLSKERARKMLDTLEKMRKAANLPEDKVGAGFRLFKSVAQDLNAFGASEGSGMTRANYLKYQSAIDQKLGETQAGDAQGFGEALRAVASPFFSAGRLFPVTRDETGRYHFSTQNPRWR